MIKSKEFQPSWINTPEETVSVNLMCIGQNFQ